MLTPDETPTFNLKAVVHETGLKPDTLRAWERRYGLPQPDRTEGGHRLYSQYDIDILKWLITRQGEGLSISRAVDLWRTLKAEGQDPLRAMVAPPSRTPRMARSSAEGQSLDRLRDEWVSACLAFGELGAEQVLSQAFALYPVETVCIEVLQAGLGLIGQGWYEGQISVQQEHFASELAIRRLEVLLTASPAPTRPGLILVGCPPGEEHTFSPLLLTLFLRRQGWEVIYLGANVPAARLQATLDSVEPHLVIMAAQQLPTAAALLEIGQILHQAEITLAFGGLIFNRLPGLRSYIPGYFLGERLEEAITAVERCLTTPADCQPVPASQSADETHRQALSYYRAQQGIIEAEAWRLLRQTEPDLAPNYLANGNKHMARNIEAALTLGNLDFLDPDIAWVEEMLGHYRLSTEFLPRYLQAYYEAARPNLDQRGQILVDYLAQLSEEKSEMQ